jgi:hypothetical protein
MAGRQCLRPQEELDRLSDHELTEGPSITMYYALLSPVKLSYIDASEDPLGDGDRVVG